MELHQDAFYVIIALTILVGAIQCFYGYRIFKFILGLTGFLLGGVLAAAIGSLFSTETVYLLLSGVAGGVIGAALMVTLYFVGIFVIGGIFGGVLGVIFYAVFATAPDPVALLLLSVITGVFALVFQKFMIIASTGFAGAWAVVFGVAYFITNAVSLSNPGQMFSSDGSHLYAIILSWLALGFIGVYVQYRSAPGRKVQRKAKPDSEKSSEVYLH